MSKGTASYLVSQKPEKLTKGLAEWYMSLADLPGERDRPKRHVAHLVRKMEAGDFLGNQVHLSTVDIKGKTYKLNGQHTCQARLECNGTHDYDILHDHYKVPSEAAAGELYMQFDPSWGARFYPHIFKAYNTNAGTKDDASWVILRLFASAVAFDRAECSEYGRRDIPGDMKCKMPKQEPKALAWFTDVLTASDHCKHLLRDGVACAMYQTQKVNKAQATDFWSKVRDGEMLKASDPAMRLRTYLLTVIRSREAGVASRDPFRKIYAKCLRAWNAFRANTTTNLNYYPTKPLPVAE